MIPGISDCLRNRKYLLGDGLKKEFVEIANYQGQGFKPLVIFGDWRVAALRYLEKLELQNISEMERHTDSDEVFILVEGSGELFIAGNNDLPSDIQNYQMKIGEICNVKKNTWHTLSLSKDAHVIIVENNDTNSDNSEVIPLESKIIEQIRNFSHRI